MPLLPDEALARDHYERVFDYEGTNNCQEAHRLLPGDLAQQDGGRDKRCEQHGCRTMLARSEDSTAFYRTAIAKLLRRLFLFLLGARAREDAHHAVISFMASVLVHSLVGVFQRDHHTPGLGPGLRVINCNFVFERFGPAAGEALNYVKLVARIHEGSGLVVGRIDD